MAIKLYHCRDTRSMRPFWTLEELGIDYELVKMAMWPRFNYEGYLKINPLGTVPTMTDDSITMTESSGMAQYLVDKYGAGSSLGVGVDEPCYGEYLNWLHRSDATLTFPQTLVLRYSIFEKPERRQPQVAEDYTQWFLSRLRCVEEALQDHDYLCGDRFTIADICVHYALYLGRMNKLDGNFGPKTIAYLDRLMERPAFQRCLEKQADLDPAF
jgi:glutathione S-transferase